MKERFKFKISVNRIAAVIMLVIFTCHSISSYAAVTLALDVSQKTVYRNTSADIIFTQLGHNISESAGYYDNVYYRVVGRIVSESNDNKSFTLGTVNGGSGTIYCASRKTNSAFGSLKSGDLVAVYGKVSVNTTTSEVNISVDYAMKTTATDARENVYTLVKNFGKDSVSMDADTMLSRSLDGRFDYKIPASWAEVESKLPNVSGYQYELNRLGNYKNAEFLFVFYVDDSRLSNRGDITKEGEVRRAIIRNIIPEADWILYKNIPFLARDFDVVNLKTDYATFGSYSGNYHDAGRNRYYTEFMFLPDDGKSSDDKAVRVLLYVYTKDNHADDILLMMRQMDIK